MNLIQSAIVGNSKERRIVSDILHGTIELPEICWKIIDTPQFQRLKNIKQLGMCECVYPCANHDRKQHSLGVAYLAGVALRKLVANTDANLNVTEKDITLVQIAGLCHDLGHGPFSHSFNGIFMPLINVGAPCKHEVASIRMFRRLLEDNPEVNDAFKREFPDPLDKIFVQEALSGIGQGEQTDEEEKEKQFNFIGRGLDKAFLYQIVSNFRSGVDVDKFDYIMRDSIYLDLGSYNVKYLMENMIVIPAIINQQQMNVIAFREKVRLQICELGLKRQILHQKAYQHKTNKCTK